MCAPAGLLEAWYIERSLTDMQQGVEIYACVLIVFMDVFAYKQELQVQQAIHLNNLILLIIFIEYTKRDTVALAM